MRFGIRWVFPLRCLDLSDCWLWLQGPGLNQSIRASYEYEYEYRCTAGLSVCACAVCVCAVLYAGVRASALHKKAFQESVRRTWHLCNLWHSKDFQLSASSCMAKQQREALTKLQRCQAWVCHINYLLPPDLVFYASFSGSLETFFSHLIDPTRKNTAHRW